MANDKEKRGLGRGLSALLADVEVLSVSPSNSEADGASNRSDQTNLPIDMIEANSDQPRRDFSHDELKELADSLLQHGLIQPIIVRSIGKDRYQIIAGERRWRAAQIAKFHQIPALVRTYSDQEVQELALVENIQREDLNPIEEASAYKALMEQYGHTQEALAKKLGKSRSHIANMVRLMNLPMPVLKMVRDRSISMGHARALLPANNPFVLARKIVENQLSVRDVERLVAAQEDEKITSQKSFMRGKPKDADTILIEKDLAAHLKMKVQIEDKGGKGSVKVSYKSLEELDEICRILRSN